MNNKSKINYIKKSNGMNFQTPPKLFLVFKDSKGVQIIIQNDEKWYKQIYYLIWFFGWGFCGLLILYLIFFERTNPYFRPVFISFGSFAWLIGLSYVIYDFLFQIQGRLIIEINKTYFIFRKELFSWKRSSSFEIVKINKIEVNPARIGLFRSDGYELRMHYQGRFKLILERKNKKEVQELLRVLQKEIFGKKRKI